MIRPINPQRYHALVEEAQSAAFSGWDFSWLSGRMIQEDPPWDYPALVQAHMATARNLLDMGTGGGEFLASLPKLPPETHATESYPPNQAIAQARLRPLGVHVHAVEDDTSLPFDDRCFDLVINRHDSYDTGEVHRILKPGGMFITQQVGELDNLELNQMLQTDEPYHFTDWGLESETFHLQERGFSVIRAEKAALRTRFLDIGAVVYYLKAIPWQIEGFSLASHADKLVQMHNFIEGQGAFVTTAHRFLIIACKEVNQP
jgi:SAM-dependent methyltransferase